MAKEKPHIALRILKFFGWLLLAIIVLVVSLRLSLKTQVVHNFVKDKAISIANENLNGTLKIDRMQGDLWREITAANISLVQNDTLLTADTLNAKYDILSLLSGTFSIHELTIAGLDANVEEEGDQQFNVQNIVKEDTTETTSEGSAFGFEVESLLLRNSSLTVFSPSYLPDSSLGLKNINAAASFALSEEISASLSSLSFRLQEGRLPQSIAVKTAGSYKDEEITLQELLIETGRSALNVNGRVNLQDSTLNAEAQATPFSLSDIQPYLDNELPGEDFEITIQAAGRMSAFNITINVEGEGFDELLITSGISLQEEPTLNKMGLSVQNVNVAHFTNDSVDADIGEFRASLEGVLTSDFENSDLTWGFSTTQVRYEEYNFEQFFGSGILNEGNVLANIQLSDGRDKIIVSPDISNIFSEIPDWQLLVTLENIDPAWWAQNPELKGSVSLNGQIHGSGFELSNNPWEFTFQTKPIINGEIRNDSLYSGGEKIALSVLHPRLTADTISIAGNKFSDVDIRGSIDQDSLKVNGEIQQIENRFTFYAAIADFANDAPSYNFEIQTSGFDASEIAGLEDFTTSINLKADGSGTYFDLEKMEMNGSFHVDSSYFNGAPIDLLSFDVSLVQNILTIPDGNLESQMMAGSFSAHKKIMADMDPEDELNLDLQLKHLQPIAQLLGAERINAEGSIRGRIQENGSGFPEFDGMLGLSNIYYDEMFRADEISGEIRLSLEDIYNFDVDFNIVAPTITGVTFQDVLFRSDGTASPDSLEGNFGLDIQSVDAGEISQRGTYAINLNTLKSDLTWNILRFQTPARLLSLESPFNLSYENGSVSTDTLSLISETNAYLKLAVPLADSLNQEAWIEGQNFNFGILQEMLFRERFVDGILQGEIAVSRRPGFLAAHGAFQIKELNYLDAEIDLLDLNFDVGEERLSADGSITIRGQKKIVGSLNVPFVLEDPATLNDSFFEESVEGSLTIEPLQLSRFSSILEEFNITGTEGIISFSGTLNGTAGAPAFDGRVVLDEPTLSGINIDSAFAEFSYDHVDKNIFTLAEIHAREQKAASINTDLPISVDFRTFEINMPDETDTLNVNLSTHDFNLAVFNDFLDGQYLAQVKGLVNANVQIKGTTTKLMPLGYLRVQEGEARVPIAGITLQKINSEINFTEQGLNLKQLSMNSGGGDFSANGAITLEGLEATDISITTRAQQFKLANTADYNLTIDLNSTLAGPLMRPTASGDLTVRNGFIYLQDFGERSVEAVELEGEEESSFSLYDSLAIEMQFRIDRNFYVRNSRYLDLEVELTGELEAQKETAGDLQLFGSLSGDRGYARPLGKRFELEEGDFTFSGPISDPNLSIRTSYVPQTSQKEGNPIVLYYIIEGTAQEPEFRFESDPQMEQQDIIAYTLFGRPFYALDSWQQLLSGGGSGSSPTDLLVDVLLDEVEALATRELGIDVVQIDNTRSGSDAVTSIKTGWYLNRRTFFSVVNEISSNPKTLFILEYMLKENLDLILTQGDDNRQGIDLRWQYEY
ncbi:MAG: translocation/assembly module TamB domain-containing protein [Balneolaceae bacterium]